MDKQAKVFGRAILGILIAMIGLTIIPELLSAKNDLAVFIGIVCIVGCIFLIVTKWASILKFFNLHDDDLEEKK